MVNASARTLADHFALAVESAEALPQVIAETTSAFQEARGVNWPAEVNAMADKYEFELGELQKAVEDAALQGPIDGERIMVAAARFESRATDALAPCSAEQAQ